MSAPVWVRVGVGLGLAAAFAFLATPVAIRTARHFAFFDLPAGYKGHAKPTPYLGGTAVMLAFALAILVGAGDPGRTLPLLGGVAALAVVGTVDDRRNLSPGLRVAAEFAVGVLISVAGLGWKLGGGPVIDAIVTAIWVVAVVNAFNLFDNMDGAASSMALVAAGGACVLAIVTGNTWVAVGSAALCGACLGFLPHNLASPARIFLGDGGSMPLGFIVAALVAGAAHSAEPSSLALLVGFLLVGIPVLDTCLVIFSRTRRGVPVLTGGRDHLTHRTRERMRTARRVAVVLGSAQALLSAIVICASRASSAVLVYIVLGFIVCAAATIVALDDAVAPAPGRDGATADRPAVAEPGAGGDHESGPFDRIALVGIVVLGFGAGLSPLFSAYYDSGVWVPIGLALVVAAAAGTLAQPLRLSRPMALALAGLCGLGLWSLLSSSWGHAVEQATVYANQWLSYAALLLLLLVLLRRRVHATVLLAAVGLGIGVVAVSVLVRLLGSDPAAMFISGRLNSPLGYINGEGCVFAIGCWFGLALAERGEPPLAGVGAGMTVVCAGLSLLSQSRGAAIATFAALLVSLGVVPGARRRLLALAVIAVGIAASAPSLANIYSSTAAGGPPASVVHSAVGRLILAAVGVTIAWTLLVAVVARLAGRGPGTARALQRLGTVAAILVVLLPLVVALTRASRIERALRTQWHSFVHVSGTPTASTPAAASTRLFSGGGNRYDYWRVAWDVFKAHPVAGIGAGGYTEPYFRQRQTTEAIQNPHSVELQTLAELGLVGAAFPRAARCRDRHRRLTVAGPSDEVVQRANGDGRGHRRSGCVVCRRERGLDAPAAWGYGDRAGGDRGSLLDRRNGTA